MLPPSTFTKGELAMNHFRVLAIAAALVADLRLVLICRQKAPSLGYAYPTTQMWIVLRR